MARTSEKPNTIYKDIIRINGIIYNLKQIKKIIEKDKYKFTRNELHYIKGKVQIKKVQEEKRWLKNETNKKFLKELIKEIKNNIDYISIDYDKNREKTQRKLRINKEKIQRKQRINNYMNIMQQRQQRIY